MQKFLIPVALCGVVALAATGAFSGSEEPNRAPMLSYLKVGQRVSLQKAGSAGFNVVILNNSKVKEAERATPKFELWRISDVGPDFIVLESGGEIKNVISSRAIDVISQLPEVKDTADEEKVEGKSKQ